MTLMSSDLLIQRELEEEIKGWIIYFFIIFQFVHRTHVCMTQCDPVI